MSINPSFVSDCLRRGSVITCKTKLYNWSVYFSRPLNENYFKNVSGQEVLGSNIDQVIQG